MKEVIEQVLIELESIYKKNISDFFFTEKELHSYFLNLCFSKNDFIHNNYLLVHAEYPSPFKCSYNNQDIVKLENDNSKKVRAHIDMIFLNPTYVDWVIQKNLDNKYISGIPQSGLFHIFSQDLNNKYEEFYNDTKESIIKYAIEFKYIRHGYLGTKYPIKEVIQDIEKMRLLKNYPKIKYNNKFSFVENTLSEIFIGERCEYIISSLKDGIVKRKYDSHKYNIVVRNS